MTDSIVVVDDVTKTYSIGEKQQYYALRDGIMQSVRHLLSGNMFFHTKKHKEFVALKHISFSMEQGDILGVIGANGAGKSTLLKLLSGITRPTSGEIRLRGRVASLLEVGTGFNPELTGRENIFLNGAILGMSQREIKRKFDEIVSFAETELFLDTPVKHYSSGMYMRLAFAVAAHLESEILLVDEVLSVGDMRFQKKSLGKMQSISQEGRTVVFVSHSMPVIEKLCTKSLFLSNGQIVGFGLTKDIIRQYLHSLETSLGQPVSERTDRIGKRNICIEDVDFLGTKADGRYSIGDDVKIKFTVRSSYGSNVDVRLVLTIYTENQQGLITCDSAHQQKEYSVPGNGISHLICTVLSPPINYGIYHINVAIFYNNEPEDWISSIARFTIDSGTYHDIIPDRNAHPVLTMFNWEVK